MAGPWEKYGAAPSEEGPWAKYEGAPPAEAPKSGAIRRIADMTAVPIAQGIVGVPEAAVGLADLVTGGQAGKLAEEAGFRPKEARQIIGDALYSEDQKAANRAVSEADGFVPTLTTMVQNPSTIARTAVESVPSMLAGGAISRVAKMAAPALNPITAGAMGEGAIMAGAAAEQIRQETADGLLTPTQIGAAVLTGIAGAAISRLSGGRSNRQGLGDLETSMATGKAGPVTAVGAEADAKNGILRRVGKGVVNEGVLEEMPQSATEQVLQNFALDKPLGEGVGSAAAAGLVTGGVMGGVMGPLGHGPAAPAPAPAPAVDAPPPPPPGPINYTDPARRVPVGPISRALLALPDADAPAQPGAGPISRAAGFAPLATAANIARTGTAQVNAPAAIEGPRALPNEGPQDITDNGQPFRSGLQAARAAKQAGLGFRPVPVDGGYVVRRDTSDAEDVQIKQPKDNTNAVQQRLPAPPASATDRSPAGDGPSTGPVPALRGPAGAPTVQSVTGQKLDDRWTEFSPESGTKAIPRATMPQVKAEHRGALVNFLNARGITHEQVDVPAQDLKPTQAEFSPKKVQQARDFTGGNRAILVSSDGHILDGHHQWIAALESGKPVKAIRLNAPIDQLVTMTRRFPSAETAGAMPATAATPDTGAAPAGQAMPDAPAGVRPGRANDVQPGAAPAAAVAPAPAGSTRYEVASPEVGTNLEKMRHHLIASRNAGRKSGEEAKRASRAHHDKAMEFQALHLAEEKAAATKAKRAATIAARAAPELGEKANRPTSAPQPASVLESEQLGEKKSPSASNTEPARYGRDGTDLAEGGKPFKTKDGAQAFRKKHRPQSRVVKVDGGYALRDKTDAEIQNDEAAGKRRMSEARAASYKKNPFLTFLAERGLYHVAGDKKSQKAEFSPDRQISVPGYSIALFRRDGKMPDALLQPAIEEGYLPQGADENQLEDLIRKAVSGQRMAPLYAEGAVEQEMERRIEAQQEEEPDWLGPLDDADLEAEDFDQAGDDLQAEVRELMASLEAQGVDYESVLEDVTRKTQNGTQNEYLQAARQALQSLQAAQGVQPGGEGAGGPVAGARGNEAPAAAASAAEEVDPATAATAALIEEARRFKYRSDTIERLLGRDTDPADGFTQHLFEVAMPRARAYDRIMRESNGDPSGIEFKSEGTGRARYAVVLPDASQQGKWRISYFDERGFSSHHVEETRDAAVKSMVADGFTIESRGTLDELAATREWKLGTDYADIIDQLNRKIITHDEFMRLQAKLNEDYERDKNGAPRAEAVAQGPDLAAPTQQDVLAQQERRENADALDERARIDREAAAQTLTAQTAPEQRKDTTGDIFGGPTVEDAMAEKARKDAKAGKPPAGPDLFSAADPEPAEPAAAPAPSADTLRAQADLNNALADLGDLLGRPFRANIAPEQEAKLVPILTRVLDAAFRMGYYKFKDAARFALDTIREKIGADVADALTLEHLQGAYIAMSGKYRDKGAETVAAVAAVESLADLAPAAPTPAPKPAPPSPIEQAITSAKSLDDVVKWIAENSDNASYRAIAARILPFTKAPELIVVADGKTVPGGVPTALNLARGVFFEDFKTGRRAVFVKDKSFAENGMDEEVILHEALHAATNALISDGNLRKNAGTPVFAAVQDLYKLQKAIVADLNARDKAGTLSAFEKQLHIQMAASSTKEVLAWGLTNADFQTMLRGIKVEGQSGWSEFVAALRKMLGLAERHDDALSELITTVDKILAAGELQQKPVSAPAPAAKAAAAATRTRPRDTITFPNPVTGPSGQQLVAYTWQWKPMEMVDKRGEDRTVRISNWQEAATNPETGRDVVHQFTVRAPGGDEQTVSAESAMKLLGYVDAGTAKAPTSVMSAAKTLAKWRMAQAETKALLDRFKQDDAEVKALALPAMPTEKDEKGWWNMGDASVRQIEAGPLTEERKRALIGAWRDNRMQERGWKTSGDLLAGKAREIEDALKRAERKLKEATSAAAAAAPAPAEKPASKIEDFGQKLEGARKDYAATLKDAEAVDIAAEPLSKSWPEPDYDKLLAGGADPYVVAFIHAARDEVPTKPQKGWKLKGWVDSVETLRGAAKGLLDGSITREQLTSRLTLRAFDNVRSNVGSRAELYELVGHAKSLKGVTFAQHHYNLYKGQENVTKWVVEQKAKATVFGNWPRELAVADTKAEMLEQFKAKMAAESLDGDKAKAAKGQFIIYRKRNQEGAFIGKKIGREYIDLKKLPDVAAARAYLESNTADLSAALERYKDTPFERNAENRPRVGDDHRNGAAVTPEVFADTFGFRGVQFGNYVEQDRRQSDLNQTFDALMDMAAVLGVPPRALSLNGRLGLAFGARGKGGKNAPAAHYEPDTVVINLTKGNGPGSLGHEWWHAVDNYFGKEFGEGGFATDGARVDRLRAEMQAAFKVVRNATQVPTLRKRAAELDKRRTKPYWNTPLELSARAFESYLIAKLNDQGAANDYLANVVDEKVWNLSEEARATFFGGEAVETYPYPGQAELPGVRAAFDEFFKVVETREDDAGNVAMFSRAQMRRGDTIGRELRVTEIQKAVSRLTAGWLRQPDIHILDSMEDAPGPVREVWQRQNSQGGSGAIEGFHYRGGVYLLADALVDEADVRRVLFHEALGHFGLRNVFGNQLKPILQQIATMRQALVRAKAKQYGLDMNVEADRLMAAEEVLAEMAQTRPELGWVQRAIAAIRRFLRAHGVSLGLSDNDIIANYILPARGWVERGRQSGPSSVTNAAQFARDTTSPVATETEAFRRWFKGSKVVDAEGKPKVMYHGSGQDLSVINSGAASGNSGNHGIYFTADEFKASAYASNTAGVASERNDGGAVYPVYLSLQNPLVIDRTRVAEPKTLVDKIKAKLGRPRIEETPTDVMASSMYVTAEDIVNLKAAGYDGIINNAWGEVVAFRPEQIKSAIGNRGTFDPGNPDIMFSRAARSEAINSVVDHVNTLVGEVPGKLSWWHKTVGTMQNLALRSAPFKRVFDGVQNFINDVSFYATEAADLAPTILPKLETWSDLTKSPLSAEDTKALQAPVFEGTLKWTRGEDGQPVEEPDPQQAGIVWTPEELRDRFQLTGERQANGKWSGQIGLYREARDALDKSLTNLAVSDMLRFAGRDAAPIASMVMESDSVGEAADTLGRYIRSLADADPARASVLNDTADKIDAKAARAQDLIRRGYAPLSRFGTYTLEATLPTGERYFGMFETEPERRKMLRTLTVAQATQVSQGTLSQEAYKIFAGVSPETLELFGDLLGLESQGDGPGAQAFQEYLKATKSNRSAMKRLIERKGIAGFSEDVGRVLAGFIYSNARQTSTNLHTGEITQSLTAMKDGDKTQGELLDSAVKLVEYIRNPKEEAQALRGLLFAQYIGGSVASALVNMTQPVTMTLPWLSQYGGLANAGKQLAAAARDAAKGRSTGNARLDAALLKAEEEGIVSPQEVHQLMAQAAGRGSLQAGDGTLAGDASAKAGNALSKVALAWGKGFSLAEQFNRRVTFIAAWRNAEARGLRDPAAFAEQAVAETQGVYNKGNKPAWARGAVGSTIFTFKQYSIAYVEMLHRMATRGGPEGKRAALYALGILFLLSGVGGGPGADDLDDIISGALQAMGYNFDSKAKRREFLTGIVGQAGADFVERGVSGIAGVPIDVSGRLGMGNLIPGTGMFVKKTDHTRDVAEIAGPAGDLANRAFQAGGSLVRGDVGGAVHSLSPTAIRNIAQAYDMATMGMYRDQKGNKVIDTDAYDAFAKAVGFQPSDVKRIQDATSETQRRIALNKMRETEIADKWAQGVFEKDTDKIQAARDALAAWNTDNPDSPIRINFMQIRKRVLAMGEDKTTRIAKTAPVEIRAAVKRELAEGAR